MARTRGSYLRDFYFIPTILYHNGDGVYATIELAWLKWYVGFCWIQSPHCGYFIRKGVKENE